MKRLLVAAFVFLLGIGFANISLAQDNSAKQETEKQETTDDSKTETTAVAKEVKEGKAFNVVCPVSTEDIDDPVLVEYKGKTYGVCCKTCLKKFIKDPEKYISRLNEDGTKIVKKKDSQIKMHEIAWLHESKC